MFRTDLGFRAGPFVGTLLFFEGAPSACQTPPSAFLSDKRSAFVKAWLCLWLSSPFLVISWLFPPLREGPTPQCTKLFWPSCASSKLIIRFIFLFPEKRLVPSLGVDLLVAFSFVFRPSTPSPLDGLLP